MRIKSFCFLIMTAFLFLSGSAIIADDTDYRKFAASYLYTQKLAECLTDETIEFPKGQLSTENLNKYRIPARKSRYNSERLNVLGKFSSVLESQLLTNFQYLDRFMEDIRSRCVEESGGNKDLVYAIAICKATDSFINGKYMKKNSISDDTKKDCRDAVQDMKSYVVKKTCDRFDDASLRNLVEAYKNIFPKMELLYDRAKPASFNDCCLLLKKALKDYDDLDRYSSAAEFEKWGKCMLNVLLLNPHPVLVAEFENQLKLYRKTFKSDQAD